MSEHIEATFCVSPDGDDAWSGRFAEVNEAGTDGPFATLGRARDAVRALKGESQDGLKEPLTVMVRGGNYFLDQTLVLTEKDGGTADCPVTWSAYPGERPVLSGGRKIGGWRPYQGEILQCDLPQAAAGKWRFRQLFFNGGRQRRARYPKFEPGDPICSGWAFVDAAAEDVGSIAFEYKEHAFPRRWAKPQQAEVFLIRA